jgi:hypothetical protein
VLLEAQPDGTLVSTAGAGVAPPSVTLSPGRDTALARSPSSARDWSGA